MTWHILLRTQCGCSRTLYLDEAPPYIRIPIARKIELQDSDPAHCLKESYREFEKWKEYQLSDKTFLAEYTEIPR